MIIKICGLTNPCEVNYLKENKVDLAGMVLFFEKSKRNISVIKAKEIINMLHPEIKAVAVTVCPTKEQIDEIEKAGFDYIQIHGLVEDEIISGCALPILKAFNVEDLKMYEHYLGFEKIKGFVFDAGEPGSGKTFDWDMLKALERKPDRLYILAGGLNDKNVKKAIEHVRPDGVDVSSGVEYEEGMGKDPERIYKFVMSSRNLV